MNKKFLLALGCALVFGLLALFVGRKYLEDSVNERFLREQVDVVVAVTEIPVGTEINASQISMSKRSRSQLPEKYIIRKEDVIGRVAVQTILATNPVTERSLAGRGEITGIGPTIPKGYRLMSIPVNESSSVAGFVSPGNFVDVIAVTQTPANGKMLSKVILQGIKVFATGDKYQVATSGTNSGQPRASIPNTVSLIVTPDQAERLAISMKSGSLQLALRNPADQESVPTNGISMSNVIGNQPADPVAINTPIARSSGSNQNMMAGAYPPIPISTPAPAASPEKKATPPAPTTFDVELIRGTSKEVRQFPINTATASGSAGATQQ